MLLLVCPTASAQLAGKGAISGKVADSTGAAIPVATVVITKNATGVAVSTTSNSDGDFAISTLDPGVYTVTVTASGFEKLTQENVQVNALETQTFNPKLTVGSTTQEVTVSSAPPQLETTNATLGATMENEMYSALPIEMGAYGSPDQRRATDFAFLMPGVQGNNTNGNPTTNTGVVNGSGSRGAASAVYIDGLPFTQVSGEGDPRFVWTAISVDAVDQFQVQTAGYSAIYEGQGVQNYSIKQGGSKYHGAVYEFFRNTALDTFGFFKQASPVTGNIVKPIEHQNEYGINISGPLVPFGKWRDKVFFFGNYNGYRFSQVRPTFITFPTLAEQQGNFQGLVSGGIFDPSTQATCTANSTTGPCRYRYGYVYGGSAGAAGNPVLGSAGAAGVDIIPSSQFSPISLKMQSYIPTLTNQNAQNNYLSSNSSQLSNWSHTERIDWNITSKDTLTFAAAIGRQASSVPVGQTPGSGRNTGPIPYNYGQAYAPKTAVGIVEETHIFSPHIVDQLKYGFARYNGPTINADQTATYAATAMGITNLPAGQAQQDFPIVSFAGTNAPTAWGGATGSRSIANSYSLVDNLQWQLGRHSITVGGELAWLQYVTLSATGGTTQLTIANAVTETAAITPSTNAAPKYAATSNTGLSYASFLTGQVDKLSLTQYINQEFGARFRPISPYIQDTWKVNDKLTVDIGLRYDYYPTYREVHDFQGFFDPNLTNPVTGLKGALNFSGTGTGTCNCRTPASDYFKNFGPRIGIAYQSDAKTVWRASYAVIYTHGNGVGGAANSRTGTGVLGFSAAPSFSSSGQLLSTAPLTAGSTAFPSFTPAAGRASGAGFGTGYTTTAGFTGTPSGIGYGDSYLGGRAPQYINYTFGFQHQWTNSLTSGITYVGSQGHFLISDGGNARGYWSDALDPKYLALGSNLGLTGAALQTYCQNNSGNCPSSQVYSQFTSSQALSQLLKPFPFNSVSDTYGNVSNSSYNSLQVTVNKRASRGLTFMANYTWSRIIDNGGTFRSGYAIPAAFSNNGRSWGADQLDRNVSTSNQPHHFVLTGVWDLPVGRTILNSNNVERAILGGFKFSSIYQAYSGSPLALTGSACQTNPAQSTCGVNLNPTFAGSARVSGRWGQGITSANTSAISYIAASGGTRDAPTGPFINPSLLSTDATHPNGNPFAPLYTFTNGPRTAPYGIYGPGNYQLDISLRRSFNLHLTDTTKLNLQADLYNVTNHTQFGGIGVQLGSAAFGTVSTQQNASRQAQLSGRIEW